MADDDKRIHIQKALKLIYDAIDCNKDGEISPLEFANYFKSLNIDEKDAFYACKLKLISTFLSQI